MNRSYKIIIAAIVLAATCVCMFLFAHDYNMVFWVNLIFATLAVVCASLVTIFIAAEEKKVLGMSLSVYAMAYLVIALYCAFRFVFIPDILVKKVALIHVIIFAVFLVVFMLGKAENEFISAQQEVRGREIANFKFTLETMKNAMNKVSFDAPYKKMVEHAYDALASGQTASTPSVEDVEKNILEAIGTLDSALDSKNEEEISNACKTIEKLAAERKAKLSVKANF